MSLVYMWCVFCGLMLVTLDCDGQFAKFRGREQMSPVPFPTCRADNIDCLRRGLRTFFVLMDGSHMGMKAIDPFEVNSVGVTLPEAQMSILLRNANVSGARWTKLADRRFNFDGGNSSTTLSSDLHVTGELILNLAYRVEPFFARITMDIPGGKLTDLSFHYNILVPDEVESNITYPWRGVRAIDNEGYILIGPERIAIRNSRTPSYFLQASTHSVADDVINIDNVLQEKQSILEHLSNEITTALMHTIVDNVRLFTSTVPVRYYYNYN